MPDFKDYFGFKGGTSLSKAYHLINRFSEDIDLIINPILIGIPTAEFDELRSNNQQNKFKEKLKLKNDIWVKEELIPTLTKIVNNIGVVDMHFQQDSLDTQTVLVNYPHMNDDNAILPMIRIETGTLSTLKPTEEKEISAYISHSDTVIKSLEIESFTVPTIAPAMTFWEKATILHAVSFKKAVPPRYSRHYYDLYQLANNASIKQDAFHKNKLLNDVVSFKDKFYHDNRAHYELAKTQTIKLYPDQEVINILQDDYEDMASMMFTTPPTFDIIMQYMAVLENDIHNIVL